MESTSLIPTALEYYDRNKEKYKKLFQKVKHQKHEYTPYDMEKNKIILLDKDKNTIIQSSYEIIGVYNNLYKLWSWAWSVPTLKKNLTFISRKILNYGLDLDVDITESKFLKTELITSRFRITDPIQIDLHVALASYLAKKTVVYQYKEQLDPKNPENYVVYYTFLLEA